MIAITIAAMIFIAVACIFALIYRNKLILLQVRFDNFKKEAESNIEQKNKYYEALNKDYDILTKRREDDLNKSEEEHEIQLLELEELFQQKVKEFQGFVNEYESYFKYYEKYFDSIVDIIKISDARIKQIDVKGSFKSDDEIGFFFQNIQEIQTTLNEFNLSRPAFKAPEPKKLIKTEDGLEIPEGTGYISAEQVNKILNK